MAGLIPSHDPSDREIILKEMEQVFIENLKYAADKLQQEGMMTIIEPINTIISMPGYFLDTPSQAAAIIHKVNHENLKLQLDLYHAQLMAGNLTGLIREYLPIIGHIQIAQVPDRGEPDSAGEINFKYILDLLESLGYDGFIGCEYKPTTEKTEDSLGWLKNLQSKN
ncbi:putative hydroxypyruvate isomerase [Ptychodera flava]|uniref:putative hydroxypyruvate isomerase n=1 Tax=Ptychodera flava TaxID=63121 RepID=UPI003969F4EF